MLINQEHASYIDRRTIFHQTFGPSAKIQYSYCSAVRRRCAHLQPDPQASVTLFGGRCALRHRRMVALVRRVHTCECRSVSESPSILIEFRSRSAASLHTCKSLCTTVWIVSITRITLSPHTLTAQLSGLRATVLVWHSGRNCLNTLLLNACDFVLVHRATCETCTGVPGGRQANDE